jgi:hypothetical protein
MPRTNLPAETSEFLAGSVKGGGRLSLPQYEKLHDMELLDVKQQITMRPLVAIFFGALLIVQNIVVFLLVWWALRTNRLGQLQWIFSALVAGSLAETYKVSQLIVNKLFEPIDYADKHERFR